MSTQWLCFRFENSELLAVISALLRNESWSRVRFIFISFRACPNAKTYAETALKTTKRLPSSKLGRLAKYQFYIWQYNWIYRTLIRSSATYVACANGLKGVNSLVVAASRELEIPVLFVERAAIPDRLQIDWNGVNYGSSIPRDPQFYRKYRKDFSSVGWLDNPPISRSSDKGSDVEQVKDKAGNLAIQKYIFCPLQVPKDSQITVYGGWINGISHYLEVLDQLAYKLPKGVHLRVKEHPTSPISFAQQVNGFNNPNIILDNKTDSMDLIRFSKAVLTINSTIGFEAFYFEKTVITLGKAFYSFGNLTSHAENYQQLTELVENIDSINNSNSDRDLFMRFLYSWYPKTQRILDGKYSFEDVKKRFAWLEKSMSNLNHNR